MITPDIVASMEDHDSSIPTLNTAVMMYHLQQYADAMSVLEPLYSNVEPIDEIAALQVCLLMLDITLASHQPGKAAVSCRFLYLSLWEPAIYLQIHLFCYGFISPAEEI
jgi:hypothetical protein